jgi:hypothetical protein
VGGACGTHGRGKKVYKVLVGKPEGKRPLGRPRRRWENKIRVDFSEIVCGVEWIQLARDMDLWRALINALKLRVSINCVKFVE